MPVGIGAGGVIGIAFEATRNTYAAPTKYFPIRSENLKYEQDTQWRRVIRGVVDPLGGIGGNVSVTGDIELEALPDVVPWLLYAARTTVTKSGPAGSTYTYNIIGNTAAEGTAGRSLSITVVRNGVAFGYTGCQISSFTLSLDSGALIMKCSVLGSDETDQSAPVGAYANQNPFGAGQYNFQIPTASQVFDIDTMSFEVDDNGEHQFRAKTTRGAQYIKFGERTVGLSVERDFFDKVEYTAFKSLTSQSVTLRAVQSATAEIAILVPVAIKSTYEVGLAGQGDLVRAAIEYMGTYDATTGSAYKITVLTTENIT